ncbi:hypothetical protein [Sporosarcina ureae]|uniref:hypothetical protein n=1 Tax=Sporosarcina ureae TaxID=1571 RepID=UPI0026F2446C|nr:hypothetical protein [Sporosarcina ureae]
MKQKSRLFTAALAFSMLTPLAVSPSIVSAAAPDAIVFTIDGKQVKVSYSDFQDTLMGENANLKSLIAGKAPSALGVSSDFIKYANFQDLLFSETDKSAVELIDMALAQTNNLVNETTKNSYVTITGYDGSGKPNYSTPGEQVDAEFKVESID